MVPASRASIRLPERTAVDVVGAVAAASGSAAQTRNGVATAAVSTTFLGGVSPLCGCPPLLGTPPPPRVGEADAGAVAGPPRQPRQQQLQRAGLNHGASTSLCAWKSTP